jgi:molybdopterin synthase catalytic subunit
MSDKKTSTEWIDLLPNALPTAEAVDFVHDEAAGGIDIFLGTTRAEANSGGTVLHALDYEAYGEMALQQLQALVRRARERWPILKLALLHRTGRVPLGQPSVLIAVSTPHRAESFEACRFLIDELKRDVAIWKKEVWSDGTGTWVHPGK